MLDTALETLRAEIQDYLKNTSSLGINNETVISLCNVMTQGNEINIKESLGLTLINIEEEKTLKSQVTYRKNTEGSVLNFNPEIKLNLYILIAANFDNYETALKYISCVLNFFQGKAVFDHTNTPSLDPSIEKLIAELYTMTFEQQNYLWASVGAKMIPSLLYKIRMLVVQESVVTSVAPFVTKIITEEKSLTN